MKKYIDKCKKTLIILLLPMVSYGLLGPLEIFFGNEKDFNFWYTDFYGILVGLSLLAWLMLALLIALLPERFHRIVNTVILAIGINSYIQNMFMNTKLSEDDGSPMRWETLGSYPIINLVIWVVLLFIVLAVCMILKKKWDIISLAVSGFFSAIQLVAVVSLLLTSVGGKNENGDLQMSGRNQLKVSGGDNIIVFVLDTYGSGQLEHALGQYPDMLDGLHDFTYYNNADCHYYCTFPSMTNMLTGNNFDFDTELSQTWLAESWNSERAENFYDTLHKNGYTCNLYSGETGYVYGNLTNLEGKWDNVCYMETEVDTNQLSKLMLKMSIYRYVPYVLKPRFEVLTLEFAPIVSYVDDVGAVDDNGTFYSMLTQQRLDVDENMENAFIIQHLFGTHRPYTIDENAMMVLDAEIDQTARGLLVIVDEYLSQLQELGLYEDANVIIMADHGSWHGGDTQPIFFIKQSGENHERMQTNTAPVSLDDFQATVMTLIGEDPSDYGTSVFDWKPGDQRTRSVYMRFNDEAYPTVEGSSFNVYYGYTYITDKEELNEKVAAGPEQVIPATPW